MRILGSLIIAMLVMCMIGEPSKAQEGQEVIGPFVDLMGKMIDEGVRQQELERIHNSPEYRDQEIQPGGLTRGQVIIVQQLLIQQGYDVGAPDGEIGPKTRAVVAQLQSKAGVAITGYPTQQLLEALLQPQ